jgi:hypothetical protein
LKNLIDTGDHRDLERLVFSFIKTKAVREVILEHIAAQALLAPTGEVKVLTDVDDTVFGSLHDEQHPEGVVYPGLLAFWAALDSGVDGEDPVGDLTFVTARPAGPNGVLENRLRRTLSEYGAGRHSVLTGAVSGLRSHQAMAEAKLENIAKLAQLFPEYSYVFIGDSGQGDVIVGKALLAEYGEKIDAVLIHDVKDHDEAARAELNEAGIFLFDTYVGAATKAYQLGLIGSQGLQMVINEAEAGYHNIEWEYFDQHEATKALLSADLEKAVAALE